MICVDCEGFSVNVEMQVFAGPNDSEGLAFCLAIALFCLGQGTTGIGDDVGSFGFLIFLRENGC